MGAGMGSGMGSGMGAGMGAGTGSDKMALRQVCSYLLLPLYSQLQFRKPTKHGLWEKENMNQRWSNRLFVATMMQHSRSTAQNGH